jgi:hypothetical protein
MPPWILGLLVLASLCAGTVDGIAGGGGLITVPALHLAGLPAHLTLGTNKGQSMWGSGAAAVAYARAGRVDRATALVAFPAAFAGSTLGARLQLAVPRSTLEPLIIVMLVGAAVLLLIKKPMREEDSGHGRPFIAAALALAIGAYDGFFGPGTGTFLVVGFVALCGRSLVHAAGDAKVVNFASNLAAVAMFSYAGTILWAVALPMAAGQLCGGIFGARLALRGGTRIVRVAVLAVSTVLIVKLGIDLVRG